MFCARCGAKLPDNAQFCSKCGLKIKPPVQPVQYAGPAQAAQYALPPTNKRRLWIIPTIICGAAAIILFVLGVFVFGWFDGKPSAPSAFGTTETNGEPFGAAGQISHYENEAFCFALEYPKGYAVTEPNENNVMISDGDDFSFIAEYYVFTNLGCFVYSAEDFVDQIDHDPDVLRTWVGSEALCAADRCEVSVGGEAGYLYQWSLPGGDGARSGGTVFINSQNNVGCYTLQWIISEGSEHEELYNAQVQSILDSFRVTGPCEAIGYDIFTADQLGFRFAVSAGSLGADTMSQEDGKLYIFPSGDRSSDSRILIQKNDIYSPDEDTAVEMLRGCSAYYLDYKDQAQYLTEPCYIPVGRYKFAEVCLEYYEDGKRMTVYEIVFPYNGVFWEIELRTTEQNLERLSAILWEIMISLQFTGSHDIGGG